jgi:aryl-alcohol dehydrogenase-like predicted oxidoreductase
MQQRRLGRNGPQVSMMGLGCMGMSGTYGEYDEAEAIATIHRALELGINLIDTADTYGRGHNEGLVGRAIHDRRDRVFLATKFGRVRSAETPNGFDGRPAYVRSACDASLGRLGIETIDIYYLHRTDPKTPIEETVGAMADLVKAGKVRHLGLSEATPENIRKAVGVHPISALQSEYSLFSRDVEDNGVLTTIRELGIPLVPYSPVGRGLLTGAIRSTSTLVKNDSRHRHPRFQGENLTRNLALVDAVTAIGTELNATATQVALAWLLAQGDDIIPIPGTKRRSHLEENAGAASVPLSTAHLERIAAAVPKGVAAGSRKST